MRRIEALALGRKARNPERWETTFGQWVAQVSVPWIVESLAPREELAVTKQTVYEWIQGHVPRLERATALVEISRGALSIEDIYDHARRVRQAEPRASEPTRGIGDSTSSLCDDALRARSDQHGLKGGGSE